jgi:hypothetical protein
MTYQTVSTGGENNIGILCHEQSRYMLQSIVAGLSRGNIYWIPDALEALRSTAQYQTAIIATDLHPGPDYEKHPGLAEVWNTRGDGSNTGVVPVYIAEQLQGQGRRIVVVETMPLFRGEVHRDAVEEMGIPWIEGKGPEIARGLTNVLHQYSLL